MKFKQAAAEIQDILLKERPDANQNCIMRPIKLGDKVGIKITAYPLQNQELFSYDKRILEKIKQYTGCSFRAATMITSRDEPEVISLLLIFDNPDVSEEYEKMASLALAEINLQHSNREAYGATGSSM